jgi:glycine cleavage system transcriptional repressor
MMNNWQILTLVGADRPGIVAAVTDALYQGGWTLGEASMLRLGSNFSIMMMVAGEGELPATVQQVADDMGLRLHVDPSEGGLHRHLIPNIQIRVTGADRAGIVAQVTTALAQTGFNILELESDVAGTADDPVYIMNIQGESDQTVESLQQALKELDRQGVDVHVSAIETMIG